jgi:rod shape determining protein RodA
VTLPLISYGGSSVLTTMVALGIVMNVSVRRFAY